MTANPVTPLPSTPRAELVTVTPELAEEWLGKNTRNRPLRHAKIDQYARDMAAGRWQVTGEAIKFGTDGRLLDGQNRLHAVIKSGATVQLLVVYGVNPSAQDVMDSGAARAASDALAMAGVSNATRVAAAARVAMAMEDRVSIQSARYTHSEMQEWVMNNLDIVEAHVILGSDIRLIPLPPSLRVYCAWRLARIDADAAGRFFGQLATGIGLTEGSPIVALRRRLTGEYGTARRISLEEQVAAVFRAWNAWRQGLPLDRIVTTTRTGLTIPDPI